MRFAVFMWPKQPITTSGRWASTAATGTCQAGIGIRHTGPVKPSSRTQCSAKCEWTMIPVAGSTTHIVSGKSAARSSHKRLQQSVDDAVREQPSDDAVLVLHRVQVAVRPAAGDGHARRRGGAERRRAGRRCPDASAAPRRSSACASELLPTW